MHGQRYDLLCCLFRRGQVRSVPHLLVQCLAVDWNWIVHPRANVAVPQPVQHLITPTSGHPDRVLVKHVRASGRCGRHHHTVQVLVQIVGIRNSCLVKLCEPGQLNQPNRCVYVRHPKVEPKRVVVVTPAHPVLPDLAAPVSDIEVVRCDHATFGRSHILGRVE